MTSELKPCPFCGGKEIHSYWGNNRIWFECESCGVKSQTFSSPAVFENREDSKSKLLKAWNTRAVPDVPELVAVSHEVFYAPTREWRKTVEPEYYRKNGDLVRDLIDKSKAAEIITVLTERLKNTEAAMNSIIDERIEATIRAEAAEAKLAQYEAQEPVGFVSTGLYNKGLVKERRFVVSFKKDEINGYIIPLYTSPSPAADLKVENERLSALVRNITKFDIGSPEHFRAVYDARSALNPSEPPHEQD